MTIRIKAAASIIEWDADLGRMAVLNPGDIAEVGERLGALKIKTGEAVEAAEAEADPEAEKPAKAARGRKAAVEPADEPPAE